MDVTAIAHPNIALVKYWGKADIDRNLPAVGSISITLDTLVTTTRVRFGAGSDSDELFLDGRPASEERTARARFCLDLFRRFRPELPAAVVESENSFPTAAGLASSASGFAALVTAVNAALESPSRGGPACRDRPQVLGLLAALALRRFCRTRARG